MASSKEPAFFSTIVGRKRGGGILSTYVSGNYDRGMDWYQNLFSDYDGQKAIGEASTLYFRDPDSASLIHDYVPDARFIFILRNPIDRLYSNYWQSVKMGVVSQQFDELMEGYKQEDNHLLRFIDGSKYKRNLSRYLEKFPREKILCFIYEDFFGDPAAGYRRICEFLGIDNSFVPADLNQRYNPSSVPRLRFLQALLRKFSDTKLSRMLGHRSFNWLRAVKRKLYQLNLKEASYPPLKAVHKQTLLVEFEEDIQFVEQLLGENLDRWRQ